MSAWLEGEKQNKTNNNKQSENLSLNQREGGASTECCPHTGLAGTGSPDGNKEPRDFIPLKYMLWIQVVYLYL